MDEGGCRSDDERCRAVGGGIREADQCGEPFGDDIEMRQLGFMGQNLPIRKGEDLVVIRRIAQPGVEILERGFLGFEAIDDEDDGFMFGFAMEKRGQEGVGGFGESGELAKRAPLRARERSVREACQ